MYRLYVIVCACIYGVVIHLKDELLIAHGWNPERMKDEGKIAAWEDSSTEEKVWKIYKPK